jgi:YhcH/YjgK/YiaL family protein
MILDRVANFERYLSVAPRLDRAMSFLQRRDLRQVPPPTIDIDGRRIYADIYRGAAKGPDAARLEIHRRTIDIHLCLAGEERMGYRSGEGTLDDAGWNHERDSASCVERPDGFITIPVGWFAMFLPGEPHASLAGEDNVHKIILKVIVGE